MAFVKIVNRALRPAGVHRSPARTLPANARRVTLRLDSAWDDPADIALFGFEQSFDGGVTWQHAVSAAVYGARRDRFGGLPSVSIATPDPALLLRVFIVLGKAVDLGLEIEVV